MVTAAVGDLAYYSTVCDDVHDKREDAAMKDPARGIVRGIERVKKPAASVSVFQSDRSTCDDVTKRQVSSSERKNNVTDSQ